MLVSSALRKYPACGKQARLVGGAFEQLHGENLSVLAQSPMGLSHDLVLNLFLRLYKNCFFCWDTAALTNTQNKRLI